MSESSTYRNRVNVVASYLERYLNGEHERVWADLQELGDQIRFDPLLTDALAVAHETMRRAKYNIELLYARLKTLDYQFHMPQEVIIPPASDVGEKIIHLEDQLGVLPLSLRAWYEIIGGVNFSGSHPELSYHSEFDHGKANRKQILSDPLWVWSIGMILREGIYWGNESILISPDSYGKAAVSGGGPYILDMPNRSVDGLLRSEWHNTTFVNYLRISFRRGGFSGFDLALIPAKFRSYDESDIPTETLASLTEGLLVL
jgi:hypothetical protein